MSQLNISHIQTIAIIDYNVTDAAIALLSEKNANLLLSWDGKDFELIKEAKREVLKIRTSIEPKRKEYNEAALKHQRMVNAKAKCIVDALEKIEQPLDNILDAEKARLEAEKQAKIKSEQIRVENIRSHITKISSLPLDLLGKPSAAIQEAMQKLETAVDDFNYEELVSQATQVKQQTFAMLGKMYNDQLEIERQRAEDAAAAIATKRLQEEENYRLIEERRIFAEEQQKIRLENEAKKKELDEQNVKDFNSACDGLGRYGVEVDLNSHILSTITHSSYAMHPDTAFLGTTASSLQPVISDVNTPYTRYGLLLNFVREIVLIGGKYSYLNGTEIVADAYKILEQIKEIKGEQNDK